MARRRGLASLLAVLISAALLLWPAVWNRYPLVSSESGFYLRGGVFLHTSSVKTVFYGLFMRAWHFQVTAWPVVIVQALIAACVLQLVLRAFLPGLAAFVLVPVALVLAVCTSLPWLVSQLTPDVFGGLMLLVTSVLILVPERLGGALGVLAVLFAAGCVTTDPLFLPLSVAVVIVLLICRGWTGGPVRWSDLLRGLAVPALALGAAIGANTVLLGERTGFPDRWWAAPANLRSVMPEVAAEPGPVRARDAAQQVLSFRTGEGLVLPMEDVRVAWRAVFPARERVRYERGRQFRLQKLIPDALEALHLGVGTVLQAVLVFGTVLALRRRQALGGLYAAMTTAVLVNAGLSGALSGVHDRYQSRVVWLATFAGLLTLLAWWRGLTRDRLGASERRVEPLREASPEQPV